MYSPVTGRFLSADTIVPQPGNPQTLNRFAYALNNPLKYIDPSGHDVVFVNGYDPDVSSLEPSSTDLENWATWIRAYKGWDASRWQTFLDGFNASADPAGYLSRFGIGVFKFSGAVTDATIGALASYMEGKQDVTLVGYSLGANVVMNYMAAKHEGRINAGPDVSKFVLINAPAPGGFFEAGAGGRDPGQPFGRDSATCAFMGPCVPDGKFAMRGFEGGKVANLYSNNDWVGDMHELGGAVNIPNDGTFNYLGVLPLAHTSGSSFAAGSAFTALSVNGDHGAYYYPPNRR